MMQRFDRVLVFCPDHVTGGPEALHQLADSISRQGGCAFLVYTGPNSRFQLQGETILCEPAPASPAYTNYQRYNPRLAPEFMLTTRTLMVFPEIEVDLAWAMRSLTPCQIACWWLASHELGNTHDENWCVTFLDQVTQFYQSHAALMALLKRPTHELVPMFDYTDRNFVRQGLIDRDDIQRQARIPRSIAFFPHKGGALAEEFFAGQSARGFLPVPIKGMTRDEVRRTLATTEVFIDFGSQPGKDRVPREAAVVGNVVLLHRLGAARSFLDHSIDETYKFDQNDIGNGNLAKLVESILLNKGRHLEKQTYYRQKIALEMEEFDLQVRQFFFFE